MIRNYLTTAIRALRRNVSYSIINVSGLSLGITCGILIFSLVGYHLSFDNFHNEADRIYRFVTEIHNEEVRYSPSAPPPLGKVFRDDYTFSEKVARMATFGQQLISLEAGGEERKLKEEVAFAEPEYFDIFNLPLLEGNSGSMLREPNTAVITESVARKFFGAEDPIDKTFRLEGRIDIRITGVLKDIPLNSDRRTQVYLSYTTLNQVDQWLAADDSWGGVSTALQCFVKLRPGIRPEEVEQVLPAYVKKYRAESKNVHHYKLQPLNDVHFDLRYEGMMPRPLLWVLSFIGFVLVGTACVNFVNLATAQAIHRSKEVGIRKILGSVRSQLFWQFITETAVITFLAIVVAMAAAYAVIPYANDLFNAPVVIGFFSNGKFILFIVLLFAGVVLCAGTYPALVLSGFKPAVALRGKLIHRRIGGFTIRRTLIVAQSVISQVLIIGLIVIVFQMHYIKNADVGFNKDAVVMIPVGSHDTKMMSLKRELLQLPGVEKVSLCWSAPTDADAWRATFRYETRTEDEDFPVTFRPADEHYLATFGIELVEGRNLLPSDTVREFLVNETLVKKLGLASAKEMIGRRLSMAQGTTKGLVVGVIRDFHDQSLLSGISPLVIATSNKDYDAYAVKIALGTVQSTLALLDKTWSGMYPDKLYEYNFLDDQIATLYKPVEIMMKLAQVFSFIALFIGCMGLYGLISHMSIQKTKEIGIRKVLGGSVLQILSIFGKEFSRLILIAFAIAGPIGWMLMNQWLQIFTFRIGLSVWIFLLALVVTYIITLLTVGYQSVRAAVTNPVESLRTE